MLLMGFYLVITLIQMLFGATDTKFKHILVPLVIVGLYFLNMVRSRMKAPKVIETNSHEATTQKPMFTKTKTEPKISRYIITASEGVCGALASSLKSHPKVLSTFEDTGFWYTNGETGPEWFTVTIEANYDDKEEIEDLVATELNALGKSADNYYWG